MESTTIAEFRVIKKNNIESLLQSSVLKKNERSSFLGLFKKIEYEDNFETFLEQNTQLIGLLSGKGFLHFGDIVLFLKQFKSINIKQPEYQDVDITSILEREENAYFLENCFVKTLAEQISKISIREEELKEFNSANGFGGPMTELIRFQQDQIKKLILILSQFNGEVFYIRFEASAPE
jgi:hypothetical protein